MTVPFLCPECSARHDPELSGGLCPACALADALEPEEAEGPDAPPGLFAGHDLLEEIARGGMGIVYRARQHRPERDVALKYLPGLASTREISRERFRQEARAMAALEHPAILPIYQFAERDGVPFFTMKLAGGGALNGRLLEYRGQWKAIAALMRAVAEAVQYAHERAVFHRDLKPGNLLFDEAGRVMVADFGLAQFADAGPAEPSASGGSGTPGYVAPEVRNGEAFTAAADVWSLGAVFRELLIGGPPGTAGTPAADWPPRAPRDLIAIARKALSEAPADRYHSARGLAEDLGRWQQGRPVLARPASTLRRLACWSRRNPAAAGGSVILAGALAAFLTLQWRSQRELRGALGESLLLEARHLRVLDQPDQAMERVRRASALLPDTARPALRTEAAALLALPSWPLSRRWTVPCAEVTGLEAFSPGLDRYVAADAGGAYTIHDTATGAPLRQIRTGTSSVALKFLVDSQARRVVSLHENGHSEISGDGPGWSHQAEDWARRVVPALHPDGLSFVHADATKGAWFGTPAAPETRRVAPAPVLPHSVTLDPVGGRVFLLQGEPPRAGLWPVRGDGEPLILKEATPQPSQAVWSPDGSRLALTSATAPFGVQVFETATGRLLREFFDHQLPVVTLAWHPDGESFAAVADDLRLVWRALAPGGFRLVRPASERALAFAPDGKTLAFSPADGSLGLLDLAPSQVFRLWPAAEEERGRATLYRAAMTADAASIALIGSTHLSVWDVEKRRETARWPLPVSANWGEVAFLGKDLYLAVDRQGLWKTSLEALLRGGTPRREGAADAMLLGPSPDGGDLVVSETRDGKRAVRLWPEGDPARARRLAGGFPMIGYRLLPGQHRGFSTHWSEPDLWLWSTETGERERSLGIPESTAGEPAPDGRWLLTATASENALWNTVTWQRAAAWPAVPGEREAFAACFSPDGAMLAKALPNGLIELRAVPGGRLLLTLTPPGACRLHQLLFHPGGHRLYATQAEGRLLEWDLAALRAALDGFHLGW